MLYRPLLEVSTNAISGWVRYLGPICAKITLPHVLWNSTKILLFLHKAIAHKYAKWWWKSSRRLSLSMLIFGRQFSCNQPLLIRLYAKSASKAGPEDQKSSEYPFLSSRIYLKFIQNAHISTGQHYSLRT